MSLMGSLFSVLMVITTIFLGNSLLVFSLLNERKCGFDLGYGHAGFMLSENFGEEERLENAGKSTK